MHQFLTEPERSGTAPRRLLADKLAKSFVTAGGLGIIASILGILAFLLIETVPLAKSADVGAWRTVRVDGAADLAGVLCDDYLEHVAAMDRDGRVHVVQVEDAKTVVAKELVTGNPKSRVTGVCTAPGGRGFGLATSDGRVLFQAIRWKIDFVGAKRVIRPVLDDVVELVLDPAGGPLRCFTLTAGAAGTVAAAAQRQDGKLALAKIVWEENDFTGEREASNERAELDLDGNLTHLLLTQDATELYATTDDRRLMYWKLRAGAEKVEPQVVPAGGEPVTALGFLIGERAVVLGTDSGALSVWFQTWQPGGDLRLVRARDLPSAPAAVRALAPSQRNKGFLAADASGGLAFYYSTTERLDWKTPQRLETIGAVAISPKMDAFLATRRGDVLIAPVDHPHAEASPGAFFGKVWYEGHDGPTYTWQSTGGTDDFEIKLSIVPLIFGTLKGTIFAMLLSVPLAVLGAMFVSQFLHHDLRKYVKPALEIMAAMPSVILGFVAALWLAPVLEIGFSAFLVMPVVLPAMVVLAGLAWSRLPRATRNRFPMGSEVVLFVAAVAVGIWFCVLLNRPIEATFFGGDFPRWVRATLGLSYEQKNSVVIAIAMSFAVIPIIFTISEDAFSNVPRNLVAGSLALGANRWQTVTRVVLPTASPGIFSATMVGFGRAVGETMIVLMATGNTPIMDWNPFNGFRTLSANVAVEIPEAPHGGTLYRTLFLAALILFALTFLVNTLAEVVRQRLRRRYASL